MSAFDIDQVHLWKVEPPNDVLSVIILGPTVTRRRLSLAPPPWLVDLHSKLWGK